MNNNSTPNAKELLEQLKSFIDDSTKTKVYNHTADITSISQKLQSMKLKDEFLLNDLSEDERTTLDFALMIADVSKK